ncbi:putative spermidine/putrescine transport system permease protein [Paracoccus aminovorans]|uniref:Putative spermidine/putrescine transport system permease protein n=1 Tax=Paracoccus aminovorans TaxID=34004 RepID=A0A1I2ZRH8_9RHOB|nr:ABC transporter permease [Paracoccus aminovorans]CQR84115.1 polyamine ABC transporter substrate-binding protein [Paracoccus aminovorans]SFH40443.1 putative spermidine/putrescine transport system permease protein [Paracoccus aminovorans]
MADILAADLAAMPRSAQGVPLKQAIARAQARARRRAFLLVLPLLLFILITFLMPIGQMLQRSVYHDGFSKAAGHLSVWFQANPAGTEPDEAAFAALAADLAAMKRNRLAGEAGTRINYAMPGTRSLFTAAARDADALKPPFRPALLAQDVRWGDPLLWMAMRSASSPWTADFYLTGFDMRRAADGGVERVAESNRVYLWLFARTFILSAVITGLCLILAFPVAHLLATLPMARANLLMILVLLPFWTSLLVRTTSWIVLLQGQGVLNSLLVALGIVDDGGRLALIYNRTGTIIVMMHILLPFMILPLYSVMRVIPPSYARAARSLGATSWTTFRRIYLPQTLPGIGAGVLLVFILAVGYYITPALVGGADGQLFSNQIQFHMTKSNWSQAAALAAMLLAGVLLLYWLYDRLVGIDKLKLG